MALNSFDDHEYLVMVTRDEPGENHLPGTKFYGPFGRGSLALHAAQVLRHDPTVRSAEVYPLFFPSVLVES